LSLLRAIIRSQQTDAVSMASDPYACLDDGLELERIAVRDAVHSAMVLHTLLI
jgi:hypothetical protein